MKPKIGEVMSLAREVSNWDRWGDHDELGTVNLITPEKVCEGARCVRSGRTISLAVPFDRNGPQMGGTARFNPMLFMTRDGGDIVTDAVLELPFYGGKDLHLRFTDDVWILPSQSGTHWDALAHVIHDRKSITGILPLQCVAGERSIAASRCGAKRYLYRGVLLDIARWKGVDWLNRGESISPEDLTRCARDQDVEVRAGDLVLVRTGAIAECRAQRSWAGYVEARPPACRSHAPGGCASAMLPAARPTHGPWKCFPARPKTWRSRSTSSPSSTWDCSSARCSILSNWGRYAPPTDSTIFS